MASLSDLPSPGQPGHLLPIGRLPLVGREAEWRTLKLALERARTTTELVVVAGEPGIGKTRLLAEVARAASRFLLLRGGAYERQGQPPYVLFVEVVRSYLDLARRERSAAICQLGPLGRLLPEVIAEREQLTPLGPIDRDGLLELAAGFVRTLATETPVLLLLEDLQWADAASIDLLAYLRRRLRDVPVLMVATYRDTDVDDRHPLAMTLIELNRLRLADELRLQPLADAPTADLLSALLGGPPSPSLVSAIQRQSEGNPFFIEELVRALASDGRLTSGANGWDVRPAPGDSDLDALSPGLRAWLWARLRRLTPACLTLLETAALLGRRVDPRLIVVAQGCDETTAAVLLAEAAQHHILTARGHDYEFVHDLFRAALDQDIDPLRRRRLHEQAAGGYELLGLAESRPAALAYHLLRGANPGRALPYLIRAGERALASFADHNAVEHFSAAASLIRQSREGSALASVLPALGEALAGAGQYDAALEAYREALTLPGVISDATQAGRIHTRIGQVYLAREEADLAAASHQRAFAAFGGADHPEVARTLLQLSELNLMALSRHADGAAEAEQALAMAERLRRPDLAAEARGLLGTAWVRMGTSGGVELMNQALADALDAHEPALAGTIANRLAHHHYWEAELDESARAAGQAVDMLRGVADPHRLGWPTFWLGVAAFTRGQWDAAERRAIELTELGEQLGVRRFLAQAHQLRGMVAQDRGQHAEAIEHLGQAAEVLRTIAPGTLVFYLGRYCLALLQAGATAEGEACLAELEGLALALPPEAKPRNSGLNLVALAYLTLGRPDLAERLERDLRPATGQLHWTLVARTVGELALARGDLEVAAEYLDRSARIAARAGARPELARTWRALARLEAARPRAGAQERARAAALERQARAVEQVLGMPTPDVEAARRSVPPAAASPLSTRELEVLRLVADGLSNREIAASLVISERTVVHHVTHILDKLAVPSRAAATAYGYRHGLLPNPTTSQSHG
jgi:DNA-binding NarL/FixJ family response regulator